MNSSGHSLAKSRALLSQLTNIVIAVTFLLIPHHLTIKGEMTRGVEIKCFLIAT